MYPSSDTVSVKITDEKHRVYYPSAPNYVYMKKATHSTKRYVRSALVEGDGRVATPMRHSTHTKLGVMYSEMHYRDAKLYSSYSSREHGLQPEILENELDAQGAPNIPLERKRIAMNKLLDSLNGESLAIGVSLAEYISEIDAIYGSVLRVARLLNLIKRRKWRQAVSMLGANYNNAIKSASDFWLLYQFAIIPLISDIATLVDLHESSFTRPLDIKVEGHHVLEGSDFVNWSHHSYGNPHDATVNFSGVDIVTVKAYYTCNASLGHFFLDYLGFTIDDIPNIVWNTTRLSFLVDYFVGIGSFLDRHFADGSFDFSHGYVSRRLKGTGFYTWSERVVDPYTEYVTETASYSVEKIDGYRRVLLTSAPYPKLEFSWPSLKQFGNIAALLGSGVSIS